MKTSQTAALAAALIAMCASTITRVEAQNEEQPADPVNPVGSLDAYPTIVQTGTYPTLTWGIEYPETIFHIVDIDEQGVVTPEECLKMELRVLGASVQTAPNKWLTVESWIRTGSFSWLRIFNGKQPDVNPTQVVYTQEVAAYQPITVGGRTYENGWKKFHYTGSGSPNVVALVDGDYPPASVLAFQQGRIKNYLKPYIDDTGRVEIGPKDVLFLFELYTVDPSQVGFDLQDLAVLATFKKCKNNNGHGNNLDGIDSSNTGSAPFIVYDDASVDDEAGAGVGAYPSLN